MRSICLSGLAALAMGGCGGLAASSAGDSGNDRSTPDAPTSPMDSGASDGRSVEARDGSDATASESCSDDAAPGRVTLASTAPGQYLGMTSSYEPQIVVTATGVYWTTHPASPPVHPCMGGCGDAGVDAAGFSGTVMSLPLGGATPTTLAAEGDPGALAVDATHAYWVDDGTAIMSVPLVGGTSTTIASGQLGVNYIAVDSESVYWTSYDDVPYSYGDGGTPCAAGVTCTAYHCVCTIGSVMKVALGGGTPTTVASAASGPNGFDGIALDDSSVYWINTSVPDADNYFALVVRVPLHGGSPETLAQESSPITEIAVDATNVYWTTQGGQGGADYPRYLGRPAVVKKPLAGGAPTTLHSSRFGGVLILNSVVTDGTNVYWSTVLGSGLDVVMRVPVAGGTPATLYNGLDVQLAGVDCTSLYWTAGSDIVRLTPK